jgi:uncharacterized protein (DUF1810 family)
MNPDNQGLERFVEAQYRVYRTVCDELALGEKTSHWMWFIFPRFRLGPKSRLRINRIQSAGRGAGLLAAPILGARLLRYTLVAVAQYQHGARFVGSPDDLRGSEVLHDRQFSG